VARIVAGDRRTTVALALPAPPALTVAPGTLPPDGAATVTVTGAQPAGAYEVDAEWTCPATGGGTVATASPRTRWARPRAGR
jgi:hypothetical protein